MKNKLGNNEIKDDMICSQVYAALTTILLSDVLARGTRGR